MASDDAVRATNDDAAQCKRFAVEKGYWKDPFITLLTQRSQNKHAPEISRGYYARVIAMRTLLQKFIKMTDGNCQVVNLGAGFDTTYWLFKSNGIKAKSFVEMDFPTVTSKKCFFIRKGEPLLNAIASEEEDIQISKSEIHGQDYHLVSANLRDIKEVETKLHDCHVDKSLPTVFIAECVLVYIDSDKTKVLLKWITDNFTSALFLNYEQVNMQDKFGEVMIENLKQRDCFLPGASACASLQSQKIRFTDTGWEAADGMEMTNIYKCLPHADVHRVEKLEFMDERELLDQLFSHYCIVWAWKDPNNIGLGSIDLT
ncbi:leucine carboxyl methyltransferase 1-like [Mytilus californianus]|uniref:leucine carboxyl methyltransferase 1-like n=1 Tax=Mytilus californianus TaxID=6549 RepID=UPI0022482FC4|nr:leucine carboxyl methyltransferase 1-like [Mytilus californianus]